MSTPRNVPDPRYIPPLDLPSGKRGKPGAGGARRRDKEAFAQSMRLLPTHHEQLMRIILMEMKVHTEFKEQEVMFGYIADFAHSGFRGSRKPGCLPFIIEVDGITHVTSYSRKRDRYRDGVFNKNGVRVLRVTHDALHSNVREIKETVAEWLSTGVTLSGDTREQKSALRRTISGRDISRRSVLPDVRRNRGAGGGSKGKR